MPANFSDAEQRTHDPKPHEQRLDSESHVNRNPHPDFSAVQASRPDWSEAAQFHYTKTRNPDWKLGDGANDGGESLKKKHVEIDPYEEGRPAVLNYKLLISGIVPRPVGFIGTRSEDGISLPPLFIIRPATHPPQSPPHPTKPPPSPNPQARQPTSPPSPTRK